MKQQRLRPQRAMPELRLPANLHHAVGVKWLIYLAMIIPSGLTLSDPGCPGFSESMISWFVNLSNWPSFAWLREISECNGFREGSLTGDPWVGRGSEIPFLYLR